MQAVMIAGSLTVMAVLDLRLAGLAVVALPLYVWIVHRVKPALGPGVSRGYRAEWAVAAAADDSFTGARVVRAFGGEVQERDRFRRTNEWAADDRLTRGTLLVTDETLVAVAGGRAEVTELDRGGAIEVEVLAQRGSRLSMGQRQRIASARAILRDPRILVLDKATSALDIETEELVHRALVNLIGGRTTIAIAHRLASLRRADRLFVLDRGRVAESGTPRELTAAGGIYRRLVEAPRMLSDARALAEV